MLSFRELRKILAHRGHCGISRSLVKFVAQGLPVHTVQAIKHRRFSENRTRKLADKTFEIGFCGIVVLVEIIAEPPVILHGVIPFGACREHCHRLEKLGRLAIFARIEILHRSLVLEIHIVAGQDGLVLGLASRKCHGGKQTKNYNAR